MSFFPFDLIKKFVEIKFKIIIVGDNLYKWCKNFGYVKRSKLDYLQSKSRFSIASKKIFIVYLH